MMVRGASVLLAGGFGAAVLAMEGSGSIALLQIGLLLLAIWAARSEQQTSPPSAVAAFLGLWVLIALIALSRSAYSLGWFPGLGVLMPPLFIVLGYAINGTRQEADVRDSLLILVVVLCAYSVSAVLPQYAGGNFGFRPVGPYADDPNALATALNLGGLLATALALECADPRKAWFLCLLAVTAFVCAVLTQSKGALISMAVLCALAAPRLMRLFVKYAIRPIRLKWLLPLAAGAVAVLAIGAQRLPELPQSASTESRAALLVSALRMTEDSWTGMGTGAFSAWYGLYRLPSDTESAGYFAHNDYAQVSVELGVQGLALMLLAALVLMGRTALSGWREDTPARGPNMAWLALAAYGFVQMAFNTVLYNAAVWAQWSLTLALAIPRVFPGGSATRKWHRACRRAAQMGVVVLALGTLPLSIGNLAKRGYVEFSSREARLLPVFGNPEFVRALASFVPITADLAYAVADTYEDAADVAPKDRERDLLLESVRWYRIAEERAPAASHFPFYKASVLERLAALPGLHSHEFLVEAVEARLRAYRLRPHRVPYVLDSLLAFGRFGDTASAKALCLMAVAANRRTPRTEAVFAECERYLEYPS